MADEKQPDLPELSELIMLQRRTLSALDNLVDIVTAPRRIEIQRDGKGNITGAVSMAADQQLSDSGD
jgi:carbon monoxide dehydrogenase subunit G